MKDIIEKYTKSANRLLLLDYDGTLVNFSSIPINAIPSVELIEILNRLESNLNTKVIIISGRTYQDMEKLLGGLPIALIAEHGAMYKTAGKWNKKVNVSDLWKKAVLPILDSITLKCNNSHIEDKHFSLNWDYRYANPDNGYVRSREIIKILEDDRILQLYDLKILDGVKSIEILPREIGKGKAVLEMIGKSCYDFILSIGDDTTDEEMFEVLKNNPDACTIRVGDTPTLARYNLKYVSDVISLLNLLSLCD